MVQTMQKLPLPKFRSFGASAAAATSEFETGVNSPCDWYYCLCCPICVSDFECCWR